MSLEIVLKEVDALVWSLRRREQTGRGNWARRKTKKVLSCRKFAPTEVRPRWESVHLSQARKETLFLGNYVPENLQFPTQLGQLAAEAGADSGKVQAKWTPKERDQEKRAEGRKLPRETPEKERKGCSLETDRKNQ